MDFIVFVMKEKYIYYFQYWFHEILWTTIDYCIYCLNFLTQSLSDKAQQDITQWWIPNKFETSFILIELILIVVLIVLITGAWRYYQSYIQQVLEGDVAMNN